MEAEVKSSMVKEGDKNTMFFHRLANARRRINYIGKIRRGNRLLQDPCEMKEEVAQYFEELYSQEDVVRSKLDSINFLVI